MRVVDVPAMQKIDGAISARLGDIVLMQRAGRAVASLVRRCYPSGRIVAFAGPGNNGGDAFAACAELASHYECTVYAAQQNGGSAGRRDALNRATAAGVRVLPLPENFAQAQQMLEPATLVLDGLLGIGARADTSLYAHVIRAMNERAVPILALDVPTGVDATTGAIAQPEAVKATATITLGLPKLGLFQATALGHVGALWFQDLGMLQEPEAKETLRAEAGSAHVAAGSRHDEAGSTHDSDAFEVLTSTEARLLLPERAADSDKRKSGAPLVFAGSDTYPGAAILCTRGAARAGAGYVTLVTSRGALSDARAHLLEQVAFGIDVNDHDAALALLHKMAARATAFAAGPGLSDDPQTGEILRAFLRETQLPLVLDAGALRHIRDHFEILRGKACVITPHAGEFAVLTGQPPPEGMDRIRAVRDFHARTGITILLKGSPTLIAGDGCIHLNATGTNALATAGTGDVLTGMIATFLSQGLAPTDAARLAAHAHGLAGHAASAQRLRGVVASDIAESLAAVWSELARAPKQQQCLIRLDGFQNGI